MMRARPRVDSVGMRESLESGGFRMLVGVKGVVGVRVRVGRKNEFKTVGMDFV